MEVDTMGKGHVDFKHVREHGNFEKVAAHYGLELTGHGDQRSALCCFHQEKTGSLKINRKRLTVYAA
jgi:DNA primase